MKTYKPNSSTEPENSINEKTISINISEAIKDPSLATEIFEQLDEALIKVESEIEYVASVKFKGNKYCISGSHKEWESFFRMVI